jgi:DNA mismatch repair protein MSH6
LIGLLASRVFEYSLFFNNLTGGMARTPKAEAATPARPPPTLKKQPSTASKNQKSILGFFSKAPATSLPVPKKDDLVKSSPTSNDTKATPKRKLASPKKSFLQKTSAANVTPVPSSDAVEPTSSQEENIKPSQDGVAFSSPSRRAKKKISYAESDDEEDIPVKASARRSRPKKVVESSDDEDAFVADMDGTADDVDDQDMDDFIVSDDSDAAPRTKKRKRPTMISSARKRSNVPSPLPPSPLDDNEPMGGSQGSSTAQKWKFDPESKGPLEPRTETVLKKAAKDPKTLKPRQTESEQRYTWLANLRDMDGNPPDHPDYDPRTVYIPPLAWQKFSAFEKQYWAIKQKFFNTIVFFKKGKFYELYEHDATIGHQLFDFKLTDRVNMRMAGVPESSLDHWANQFVAKGYKIARVDQMESALAKEMREREEKGGPKAKKVDKVIHRELACVLTKGTLVEGSMLEDDMATYCVSIKETQTEDELPKFGIAFVDTATGQFFLCDFVDDVDLTKFETLVAQTRPQELLLEKSSISVKAMRILKNNTSPTTIWNHLKPGKEFWTADATRRELDCNGYFVSESAEAEESWPQALEEAKEKEEVLSAFGALLQYLRTLKIERELVSQGNFAWYDPVQKATTLVLDGQTLINLEIFANTVDGGQEGTLFSLLNRCITPFGKRMFKQWVCHPLADIKRINERLDAVDMINANRTIREQFSSQMSKMPDLERMISRIHAGSCRPDDFVRVLEGFEQIEYTMSLLTAVDAEQGIIHRLISAMPDLSEPLAFWKSAFDRNKARDERLLVPALGIEEDFDASVETIKSIESELDEVCKKWQKELGSKSICFRDVGKEIYQLEVPTKLCKNVPKHWAMMSSTNAAKRFYFPELKKLVRHLQEAQELHGQIVKATAGRFFKRFDENYATWLAAVKIIAQLDCLISLATASEALGQPGCRPQFVEDERSVVEFTELRHPCVLPNVTDFIPNDIQLGGTTPNISLLTGANAAGKSTVLRMTCVAVIMAQIGCYVPCVSARLTPVDRIMSRLGANDNIFAAQSTFFVELSETKKILSEATPRSLVILDELGRGTSSYDGVAVAQAVLHHVATHVGCVGFFATHYHSLASEFASHPEIAPRRMAIAVDPTERRVTFLYKLEAGVAEGSFGMHCAAMCGIPSKVIERAEVAAKEWEHTSRLTDSLEEARMGCYVPLGWQSDVAWMLRKELGDGYGQRGMDVLMKVVASL